MAVKGVPARPASSKFWGKLQAKVAGLKGWNEHDHGASWDDGGAADSLGKLVAEKTKAIIAEQTREAVAEYVTDAQFALGSVNGRLYVAINMQSAGSRLIVQVPLVELINGAVADAYRTAANPASQEFLSSVMRTAGDMYKLRQQMTAPRLEPAAPLPLPHERAEA